jgi:hypothetical protein
LITPSIAAFLEGPNSTMVASHDAGLVPEIARAVAVACAPDGQTVTVVLPTNPSADVIRQLQSDPRIAIVSELTPTHRTLQLKGRATSIRPSRDDERPAIEAALTAFSNQLEQIGMPRRLTERLVVWPATSIEVRVEQIFEQSPGPGAGDPFTSPLPPVGPHAGRGGPAQ